MRITTLLLFLTIAFQAKSQFPCIDGFAGAYPCSGIDMVSFVDLAGLQAGVSVNDVWGWQHPDTGVEYVLVGCANGTSILDIEDPEHPILVALLPSHTVSNNWRDIKVYDNHAFIVSEAVDHGMQVLDLMQLAEIDIFPTTLTETAHYDLFGSCHNVAINEETGFAYGVGTNTAAGGLHIVDISNPLEPVIAGTFEEDGYTHDAQIVIYKGPDDDYFGKEIAFCANEDSFTIVNVDDKSDTQLVGVNTYSGSAYSHQGWLSQDQRYWFMNDELDEISFGHNTRTYIWDCLDLDDPQYMGFHEGPTTAIDHNMYVIDNFMYQSNYRAGLRILDITGVADTALQEIAYFDVIPEDDNTNSGGTWSNYPYFKSGVIPVTSKNEGLFLVKAPVFSLEPEFQELCFVDEAEFELTVHLPIIGGPFSFSQDGLGEDVTVSGSLDEAPGIATLTLTGLLSVLEGEYDFEFIMISEHGEYDIPAKLIITETYLDAVNLAGPEDGFTLTEMGGLIGLSWGPDDASLFQLLVSTDMDFENIVFEVNTVNSSYVFTSEEMEELGEGVFYWMVIPLSDECGEGESSEVFNFNIIYTGVGEIQFEEVSIFPNPASDRINIELSGFNKASYSLQLIDLSGKIAFTTEVTEQKSEIQIPGDLARGIYTLLIQDHKPVRLKID